MSIAKYPVRIIRHGIIFFGDKADAQISADVVTLHKQDMQAMQYDLALVKKAIMNQVNGSWRLKFDKNKTDLKKLDLIALGSQKQRFNDHMELVLRSHNIRIVGL